MQVPRPSATRGEGRKENERAVLALLASAHDAGLEGLTRSELADQLGLSTAAVGNFVSRLLPALTTEQRDRGGRGPVPEVVGIDPLVGVAIGIDFGRQYRSAIMLNARGEVISERQYEDAPVENESAASLEWASDAVVRLCSLKAVTPDRVIGVGIGISAPVEANAEAGHHLIGKVRDGMAMRDWQGINPADRLRHMLQWDAPFVVDNGESLAGFAEFKWGAARGVSDALYVKWTRGVGAGIICGGALQRGSHGIAGEIGHVRVELDEDHKANGAPTCPRCGRSCVDSVAGATAILAYAHRDPEGDVKGVIQDALRGDDTCRAAVARAANYLGQALGASISLLNPARIVIGGDFTPESYGLYSSVLSDAMRERSPAPTFADVDVVPGEVTGRATILGAAGMILERFLVEHCISLVEGTG